MWWLCKSARCHGLYIDVVLRVRLLSFHIFLGEGFSGWNDVSPGLSKEQLGDVCDLLLIGGRQLVEDKAEISSQIVPCLLLMRCKLMTNSANPPPTVNGKQSCRPVRREPRAIFFRVGEMPLVSEFHCIGVPLCTQPWESGVGKPSRAAGQGFELWFKCIKKLIKHRMNAIVSRPGRGGETGRLQIQLLGFLDKPSQVAFTIILKRRPVPVGAIVWPIWAIPSSPTNSFPNQDKCKLMRASG